MKRILIGLLIVVVLLSAAVYAFIPQKFSIASSSSCNANREGVYRSLININNWEKWWPGTIEKKADGAINFRYKNYDFRIKSFFYDAIRLTLERSGDSLPCLMKIVPYAIDSMGIELSSELDTRSDPIGKVSGYLFARNIKHVLDDILVSLKTYASDMKNIYGVRIKKDKVQYQFVLSDKQSFAHYPSTSDVYGIIGRLRDYISRSGATELFPPMLNIRRTDTTTYIAQVGIPIDKELPQQQNISSKWMMKGGNILSGEVIGGPQQIQQATKQFELYIHDYQRSIIAIPFQMLITDRIKEPDSTRWVTRIYYPVI